jgi:hypothetical protein
MITTLAKSRDKKMMQSNWNSVKTKQEVVQRKKEWFPKLGPVAI